MQLWWSCYVSLKCDDAETTPGGCWLPGFHEISYCVLLDANGLEKRATSKEIGHGQIIFSLVVRTWFTVDHMVL